MLLKDKNAVIYGGGGAVGGAVARAFAREGATVFLAGRTPATLDAVAQEIRAAGGKAETAPVDALDKAAVDAHLNEIVARTGHIDISFNVIDLGDAQGQLFVDLAVDRFVMPIDNAMRGQLFTTTAAARHMMQQKSGVILGLTANAGTQAYPYMGGFGVACAAMEGYFRQLAAEVSPHGVRVVCLLSAGSPDTPGVREAFKLRAQEQGTTLEDVLTEAASGTMLKRLPLLGEVANAAVLVASDYASSMTAAVVNLTAGQIAE